MPETPSDKPGFLSRLFGRKAEPGPQPEQPKPDESGSEIAPAGPEARTLPDPPNAGGVHSALPSPAATAADDLSAAPATGTTASPDIPDRRKVPAELAGADLQPVDGREPEGGGPREPIPRSVPEPASQSRVAPSAEAKPAGWWQRLTHGMRRTSTALSDSVTGLFTKRKLDAATLEDLEDALVQADLGIETALRITKAVGEGRYDKEIAPDEVRAILA